MSYDNTGEFSLPDSFPATPGTTITAEDFNDIISSISDALSLCILRDGNGKPTAIISWNGQKLTNLANGSGDSDAVNYGQVFHNATFTAPRAQASPAQTDNSLLLATTEFVKLQAFNTALPNQAGNAGKFLLTDGTTATWTQIQQDSRGHTNSALGDIAANVILNFSTSETYSLKPTVNGLTISFAGFVNTRVCVMMVTLTNAGLHPPTFVGVNWIKTDGSETANFSDLGVAFQNSGSDRVMVVAEPSKTPWAKVVR